MPDDEGMPTPPDNLVYDLYKVAGATQMEGYDAYYFTPTKELEALDSDVAKKLAASESEDGRKALSADAYREMAQTVAKQVLVEGKTLSKVASGLELEKKADVPAGLYLMVVRGDSQETSWEEGENGVFTFGLTPTYKFSFSPELIAVPGGAGGTTANDGNWIYDLTATLKPAWTQREGSLEIVKTLTAMDASRPASFIFQVDAWADKLDGSQLVYSNVVTVDFSAAGQQSAVVEGLPAGAYVRVTEVYSGASYEIEGSATAEPGAIVADQVIRANFENTYNAGNPNGGSIVNTFTYEEGQAPAEGGQPTGGQWSWNGGSTEEGGQQ
ncbi:MAG: hypothetical protein HFJ66_05755 [Eggerthellaceae bacterium]|nr:hypothetical protein [Eggerthellaceae bacterium]